MIAALDDATPLAVTAPARDPSKAATLRSRVVWAMAAMAEEQLVDLVELAERLAPADAMATTYRPTLVTGAA